MNFSDALTAVKAGKRVRRAAWTGTHRGLWLELVHPHLADGRVMMPALAEPGMNGTLRPFAAANDDLLADDWDVIGDSG